MAQANMPLQPQDQMVMLGHNGEKVIIAFLWKKVGIILGVLGLANIGAWYALYASISANTEEKAVKEAVKKIEENAEVKRNLESQIKAGFDQLIKIGERNKELNDQKVKVEEYGKEISDKRSLMDAIQRQQMNLKVEFDKNNEKIKDDFSQVSSKLEKTKAAVESFYENKKQKPGVFDSIKAILDSEDGVGILTKYNFFTDQILMIEAKLASRKQIGYLTFSQAIEWNKEGPRPNSKTLYCLGPQEKWQPAPNMPVLLPKTKLLAVWAVPRDHLAAIASSFNLIDARVNPDKNSIELDIRSNLTQPVGGGDIRVHVLYEY